jgi:hypothetical protein
MGVKSILVALLIGFGQLCRSLDFVEVFAGEQSVSKGLRLLGYRGMSMDLRLSLDHDILTPIGLLTLIVAVARLRPGGILWAAPPCSTWVFMSRGSTMRHLDINGNSASAYVQAQNALVCRILLVCRLASAIGVHWIIEQPSDTVMFEYPKFKDYMAKHPEVAKATLQMGAFGLPAQKDTILVGTAPYLRSLERRMAEAERHNLECMQAAAKAAATALKYIDRNGDWRVQGGPGLKATQAYPIGFGAAHALAYDAYVTSRGNGTVSAAASTASSASAAANNLNAASATIVATASATAPTASSASAAANDPNAASATIAASARSPHKRQRTASAEPSSLSTAASASNPGNPASARSPWDDLDISDSDEDDWYMIDLKRWGTHEWHNNYRGEQKLRLRAEKNEDTQIHTHIWLNIVKGCAT